MSGDEHITRRPTLAAVALQLSRLHTSQSMTDEVVAVICSGYPSDYAA